MTGDSLREIFEFGPYRLEPGLGLTRSGTYVALAPKELGVLEALVRREGGVATKEELAAEVWHGQVPSDDSLTRTVYALRKALAGGCETVIGTVHRRGYRLAVSVTRMQKLSAPRSNIAKSVETAPAAYAAFLEGRQFANRDTSLDIEQAIEHFEIALNIDSDYAVALGAIAECRVYQAIRRYIAPRDAEVSARTACERALTLDAELVSAQAALGWIEGAIAWNDEAAMAALNTALALDPDYARGYYYRGWILRSMGRHESALQDLFHACTLNPYAISHHGALAYSLFCAGRAEEALDRAREMVKLMPRQAPGYTHVATYAAYLNRHAEAIAAGRKAVRLSRREPTQLVGLSYSLARAGRRDDARAIVREMIGADDPPPVRSLVVPVLIELGERDQAARWLQLAADERCAWFRSVLADPRMDTFGDLSAFRRLVDGAAWNSTAIRAATSAGGA